jgi:hypothetical protein
VMKPVRRDEFRGDGRGPELDRFVWSADGRTLLGAEYRNADSPALRHVRFGGTQVVMVTPEEVIGDPCVPVGSSYAADLGRSSWLQSFAPQHLAKCSHYRLLFYDELIDVVCETIEFGPGPYAKATA